MTSGRPMCISALVLAGTLASAADPAPASDETVQSMLAAQIRSQGFVCKKPLGAKRDARRSRPDYDVWVLKCDNAIYRVSRAPDMAAKVQPLR
jgi:hypothetical protein